MTHTTYYCQSYGTRGLFTDKFLRLYRITLMIRFSNVLAVLEMRFSSDPLSILELTEIQNARFCTEFRYDDQHREITAEIYLLRRH